MNNTMQTTHITLTPNDSLFFRESRPMESVGGAILESQFPPNPQTLIGALKGYVGEQYGVDFKTVRENTKKGKPYTKEGFTMDFGDSNADLSITDMALRHQDTGIGTDYYPAPLFVAYSETDKQYALIQPSAQSTECDLGNVHLPTLPKEKTGYKPLENAWLSSKDYTNVLQGKLPTSQLKKSAILKDEFHLGISIDKESNTAEDHKLYQSMHTRLKQGMQLHLTLRHRKDIQINNGTIRLGAEGRSAQLTIIESPESITSTPKNNKISLILTTPALFKNTDALHEAIAQYGTLISACLGKTTRMGGWNLAQNQPREAISAIPAGSTWFVEASPNACPPAAIGEQTTKGFGIVRCGTWQHL